MDKDDYLKILEEPCCYNIENYISDNSWSHLVNITHINKKNMTNNLLEKEYEVNNKIETNILKYYE
jgi:hypothetical protein